MNLKQLLLTKNKCYIEGKKHTVKGIMVHSTGANNPNLKRYVGPDDGLLGVNTNNNHWNQPTPDGRLVCVHAFIGKLKDGTIATYQTLPWDMRGWHAAGSANTGYIGFEICEDDRTNPNYFNLVYKEAVELCAHLCKQYNIKPISPYLICHSEGNELGIASAHSDVMHWFPKHGKSMDTFRADVASLLNGGTISKSVGVTTGTSTTSRSTSSTSSNSSWIWPAPGNTNITSGVGPRWGKSHNGIDISAPKGSTVVASRAGKVIDTHTGCTHFSKYGDTCGGGYGNRIYIDHQDGYITRYAHLTDVLVRVGDTVAQGQQIATSGSSGSSTGPHLHFEIRYNGTTKDPEDYVDPDNSIVSLDYDLLNSSYESVQYYTVGTIPYTPDYIIGERSSNFTQQPAMPFVNIYIGDDKLLTTDPPKPNVIQSFEISRINHNNSTAGSTATFTIFDDNWDEIEKVFSDNFDRIVVEYGYVGGVKSEALPLMLQNYSISFNATGTILSFSAMTQGQYDNLKQISIKTDTMNPTTAVKSICTQMGWIVEDENFDETLDVQMDNPFNSVQEFPVAYIIDVIVPLAQTASGDILSFYLDENNVAYFKKKSFATAPDEEVRTYVHQSGYDSVVKDISFDIKGVFGGTDNFSTATELTSSVFGTIDKSKSVYSSSTVSTITEATGEFQHTKENQSTSLVDAAGATSNQVENKLYYYMKNQTSGMYEATLTILGDPTIELLNHVRIINITEAGFLHHTSGIYMVTGIIDSISEGSFITTLKLVRNGDINDGVELLNPKTLIK